MAQFKDYFDRKAARTLADQMCAVYPEFDTKRFVQRATRGLSKLEMMDRVGQFAHALHEGLPDDSRQSLLLVHAALERLPVSGENVIDQGFLLWPYGEFIRRYGTEHFNAAFKTMIALTQRFSSEFAIRPFVRKQPDKVFSKLAKLTKHKSEHVRRWCSEGIRPRLPWGERLNALCEDPSPILPILEALKDDESLYVRRSVANCLGDIAKDHTDLVVDLMRAWSEDASDERQWLIRHALRAPIKAGHQGALEVMGFRPTKKLHVELAANPKKIPIGKHTQLTAKISNTSRKTVHLLVDFRVHYVKARGESRPKVFKWKEVTLAPEERVEMKKKLTLKQTSIRKLYPGVHKVDLQINGLTFGGASFKLTAP